jgi:hypothetical protein
MVDDASGAKDAMAYVESGRAKGKVVGKVHRPGPPPFLGSTR